MASRWMPAYVGMGSNLDDPPRQLRAALDALDGLADCLLVATSSFYRSPPMGPAGQPDYVNAVAGMLTTLSPEAMLEGLQAIEAGQGRRRDGARWGPRTLDLDLLAHGQDTRQTDTLALPHPGVGVRPFVLVPLAELAPGLSLPGLGRIAALAARVENEGVVRLEDA